MIAAIEANVALFVTLLGVATLLLAIVAIVQTRRTRRLAARFEADRKSTRLNSSHLRLSRMPSSA